MPLTQDNEFSTTRSNTLGVETYVRMHVHTYLPSKLCGPHLEVIVFLQGIEITGITELCVCTHRENAPIKCYLYTTICTYICMFTS